MAGKKTGRSTTTTQVSRDLDLVITKYAKDHNISKSQAADELFGILHPDVDAAPIGPAEPPEPEEGEEEAEVPIEEPTDVSEELGKTVKDLRTVKTIDALSQSFKGEGERPITSRDAFELKKIEKMFGSSDQTARGMDVAQLLDAQRKEMMAMFDKLMAEREVKESKAETDFYKKQLEDKTSAEIRAQELGAALAPFQEQINILNESLKVLAGKVSPESRETPTSAELEAIKILGSGIKDALVEVGRGKGGEPSEKLKDYLDSLAAIMDRINEFGKRGEAPSGEFDWRTAAINTFGEVAGEGIRAISEIEARKPRGLEGEGEEPQLSSRIIERRVYNYAMKKIVAGELTINPYEAAEELGLTANEVWGAVETLRKRGALKSPQVKKGVERKETPEKPTTEEGEIIPNVEG